MSFKRDLISSCALVAFVFGFVRGHVYGAQVSEFSVAMRVLEMIPNFIMLQSLINWVGLCYVNQEVERSSNANLLNSLDDAVFLIARETGLLHFFNDAAKNFSIFTAQKR